MRSLTQPAAHLPMHDPITKLSDRGFAGLISQLVLPRGLTRATTATSSRQRRWQRRRARGQVRFRSKWNRSKPMGPVHDGAPASGPDQTEACRPTGVGCAGRSEASSLASSVFSEPPTDRSEIPASSSSYLESWFGNSSVTEERPGEEEEEDEDDDFDFVLLEGEGCDDRDGDDWEIVIGQCE